MTDPTTEGYTVAAAEIEGMVRNLCAYALSEPDPWQRYADLTHQQVLFEGIADAVRRARGRALADLLVAGTPVETVAAKTNLAAVPKVRKLISAAGEAERVKAATAAKRAPAKAKKAAEEPPPPPVAPRAAPVAVTGKRMLTAQERLELGLPTDGPIPREAPPPKRRVGRRSRSLAER